jgi:hypothetical protein
MQLDYQTPPQPEREPPQWWVLGVAIMVGAVVLVVMVWVGRRWR